MFNFSAIINQATELFHSSNIGELMGEEEPFDLQETLTSLGLDAEVLQGLSPEEALNLLQEKGVEADALGGGPVLEQIREIIEA